MRGITLVEVLVVLVILSVAFGLVVPAMSANYDNWVLRSAGRRTVGLFRFASMTARREGTDVAGYYDGSAMVLLQRGSVLKRLEVPASIAVSPGKSRAAMFLPTGQIIASEPFVFENSRGRRMVLEVGPLPGQIRTKETMR
jgi:prepilin-type N-terminal cleavage/methylation domain-containing protein